jgi:hypothetical protein
MNINQISKIMNDAKTSKKITTPKIAKRPVTSSNRLSKPSVRMSNGIEIKEKPEPPAYDPFKDAI